MYLCSPTLSQISLKNSFGKVVFQILAKIKMTQNKNRLFAAILKRYNIFTFFFAELWIFIAHTYMVQISLQKFRWESGFLRLGPYEPSLGTNGSKSTLVT